MGTLAAAGCHSQPPAYRTVWIEPQPAYHSATERYRDLFVCTDPSGERITFPFGEEQEPSSKEWYLTSAFKDSRFLSTLRTRCPGLAEALEAEDTLTRGIRVEEVRKGNVIIALRFYQGQGELIDEYIPDPSVEGFSFDF
jgi:hypothetical protein